jgi:hypothetical protein
MTTDAMHILTFINIRVGIFLVEHILSEQYNSICALRGFSIVFQCLYIISYRPVAKHRLANNRDIMFL